MKNQLTNGIALGKPQIMLNAAFQYAAKGWYIFPLKEREKKPLTEHGVNDSSKDEAQIRDWWSKWPNANIGLDCGKSGLVVVDLDKKDGIDGRTEWDRLCKKHNIDCMTPASNTGGGGLHLVFSMPGKPVRSSIGKLGKCIDTRGEGGYIVLPPSIHPNGSQYKWDYTLDLNMRIKEFPSCLVALLEKKEAINANPEGDILEGQREKILCSQAGAMRRKGMSPSAIEAALSVVNKERCNPPLTKKTSTGFQNR